MTPDSLRLLPVGEPLRVYSILWLSRHDMSSHGDQTNGEAVLTRIDTHPGGYWRGRVDLPRALSSDGRLQWLQGTFAAEWCGKLPVSIFDEGINNYIRRAGI